jgi:hypothetical protein
VLSHSLKLRTQLREILAYPGVAVEVQTTIAGSGLLK